MDANVGKTDAVVRWMLAAVLFGISIVFNDYVLLSFFAAGAALVLAATALTRRCMFYSLIGLDTRGHRPLLH